MTQRHMHATQAATSERQEGAPKKKGILSQLSMPAVLAAILTSMTSFMLSSKLGLAGSLIGAALVSAVSTIASQLYNAMINSSVDKIHDLSDQMQSKVFDHLDVEALPTIPQTHHNAAPVLRRSFAVAMVAALLALVAYSKVVDVATQGQGIGPSLTVQAQQAIEEQDSSKADKAEDEPADDTTEEQDATTEATDEAKVDEVAADATPADGLLADAGTGQDTEVTDQDTEQSTDGSTEAPATEETSGTTAAAKESDATSAGMTV